MSRQRLANARYFSLVCDAFCLLLVLLRTLLILSLLIGYDPPLFGL
jgi:hypothetical protein